jgi:hypothetical protein
MKSNEFGRLALVIREAGGLEADDWLVVQILTRKANLQDMRIGLLLQHPDLLEYDTIRGSIISGIVVYTLDSLGLRVLFSPDDAGKVHAIEKQKKNSIIDRYSKNKRIPEALSLSLQKTSNLKYARLLRDLSADYERKAILNHADESRLVYGYIKRIGFDVDVFSD